MRTEVEIEVPATDYDSEKTYSGDYKSDRMYFKKSKDGEYDDDDEDSFPIANLKCEDVKSRHKNGVGEFKSHRMAYKNNKGKWKPVKKNKVGNRDVHCESDGAVEGLDSWSDIKIFDYAFGNYLNWGGGEKKTVKKSRLEIMQEVAGSLADSTSGVNIGLMAFNQSQPSDGGRVLNGVEDVKTNAGTFKQKVNALRASGNTPLSETMFEAMYYYQGGKPFADRNPPSDVLDLNGNYISPIEYECQSNNIILLSDGAPTSDTTYNNKIGTVVGSRCSGNCLDELAGHMKNKDMSSGFAGDQVVTTYTVGFAIDHSLLASTAKSGGGQYYIANDAEELADAFDDIVRSVLDTSSTFVAPGVAVNSFNRLSHLNALYYSVFEPETRPLWQGNLKRYKINDDGEIVDVKGNAAVDSATGFFKDTAQSWWATAADGKAVTAGGARSQLPDVVNNRQVFTSISGAALTAISTAEKGTLTKSLFGDPNMSDSDHENLIRWTRGEDVNDEDGDGQTTDARKFLADPLHSEPKLIVYGGTESAPDTTVFFGDNQGYIHAVDGETGQSYFAFMPKELLGNQKTLMENRKSEGSRVYGMDGSIVSWVGASGPSEHVYLYSGMRRGGRNYYALDATDRNAPKFKWSILGGSGDFQELGQTWSTPVKSKVNIGGTAKDVLFFAGGYDPNQDDVSTRTEDSMGRALYIVDAKTGSRLWWAGPKGSGADLELDELKYSIPASPKVLDMDGDHLADQVYVGDMGGQVWRFDLNNGKAASDFAHGGRIADFAGSEVANARRFYHTPDLSMSQYWGKRYLNLMIGSGYQAHPLNKVIDDRVYMIRMPNLYDAPVDPGTGTVKYTAITETDLLDITDNAIGQGTDTEKLVAEKALSTKSGWMLQLENVGEKMLSSSLVVDGVATVTTYQPAPSLSACAPSTGRSRLYSVNLRDGTPVRNYDEIGTDTELTKGDRSKDILDPGLPPTPKLLRTPKDPFICVGTHCFKVDKINSLTQTYWREIE
ncbi:PilC/PilY family type IV pilus protein [Marinobacter sp. S0848L]|uniref:pilus assembly protein n=1 Tax=Marinobacter sp. S0848L TaxID=2926423 RepID=UPI001FF289F2|nr:PilC/PilY family type IV pilus protein [Marinobacter sp. S0848L]MCK0107279.1 pilus assembly protein PilY [Marinobacter sp. S0848L]